MSDISVNLGAAITVQFPVSIATQHAPDWMDTLDVCDSDNIDSQTGNSAEDAGVPIGGYYMTAANHISSPGGIVKKRLI